MLDKNITHLWVHCSSVDTAQELVSQHTGKVVGIVSTTRFSSLKAQDECAYEVADFGLVLAGGFWRPLAALGAATSKVAGQVLVLGAAYWETGGCKAFRDTLYTCHHRCISANPLRL